LWITGFTLAGGIIAGYLLPPAMDAAYRLLAGQNRTDMPQFREPFSLGAIFVFGSILFGLIGTLTAIRIELAASRWDSMSSGDKVTLFAGVLIGVLLSIPFHVLAFSFGPGAVAASFMLMIVLVAVSIAMVRSMQEAMPWSSGIARNSRLRVIDTSVVIDGRIYEVCKAGFLDGKFYIPQFVINELQAIADSHDPNRRQRGRRGLDLLKHLQASFEVEVGTQDRLAGDASDPVDTRLIQLAKELGASLVTNDFNLNKVAQVHGVRVLNINDLAMAMRPVFLPGDTMWVQIERPGSQQGQGVGYLEDGTMIVVEHGEEHLGERAEVHVTQIHQSAAGRMIFATLDQSRRQRR
jgi:uncharacterized protein YacL